jgi:hypothetical protein
MPEAVYNPLMCFATGDYPFLFNSGFLRKFSFKSTEIIWGMYIAVRDKQRKTVPCTVAKESINQNLNQIFIDSELHFIQKNIVYMTYLIITIPSDGMIDFRFHGKDDSDF